MKETSVTVIVAWAALLAFPSNHQQPHIVEQQPIVHIAAPTVSANSTAQVVCTTHH